MTLTSDEECEQNDWIKANRMRFDIQDALYRYISERGRALEVLEFGQTRFSVDGISTVFDDDCMSTERKALLKYLVLRPDCCLYTKWDDEGSKWF